MKPERVAVVGAGPAGLICAETLAGAGYRVTVFDRMPSPARKFLMAGRGGLNLTHSEPLERFLERYGDASPRLEPFNRAFTPEDLRSWCEGLGEETFVGTSGRVFPKSMKASPLLRAWLRRLSGLGVRLEPRHRFAGFDAAGRIVLETPSGTREPMPFAGVVLALGGASWPRLGSDGTWSDILRRNGIAVLEFQPSNMGVRIDWSEIVRERFAGAPLKRIALTMDGRTVRGETVVTETGLEGGAVYAVSALIRSAFERDGSAELFLDLRPDLSEEVLAERVAKPRRGQSASTFLRKAAGLSPAAIGLLREGGCPPRGAPEPGSAHQGPVPSGHGRARSRAGDLERRRRGMGRGRRSPDAAPAARNLRCRGDARLGGADRRLPPAGLFRHRIRGRPGTDQPTLDERGCAAPGIRSRAPMNRNPVTETIGCARDMIARPAARSRGAALTRPLGSAKGCR
jgi:uncharacterized flavoprotein (TIGR03862 family)